MSCRTMNSPERQVPVAGFRQVVEAPPCGRLVSGSTSRGERCDIVAVALTEGRPRC